MPAAQDIGLDSKLSNFPATLHSTSAAHQVPAAYYLLPSAAVLPVTSTGKVQRNRVPAALEEAGILPALDATQVRLVQDIIMVGLRYDIPVERAACL